INQERSFETSYEQKHQINGFKSELNEMIVNSASINSLRVTKLCQAYINGKNGHDQTGAVKISRARKYACYRCGRKFKHLMSMDKHIEKYHRT
ncbi:MAG: hypothetical protein MHPSP_003087, partial [Paramarteilia canceri]